ncbi:MAG: hypothetical protein LUD12_13220, partial [Lachnospiraceae bacterium]|nr:hypothetical protein [Lachnospiraceae bacterium]
EADEEKQDVCYIPENHCILYHHKDFSNIARGNEELAEKLYDYVDWQLPEVALDEWLIEGEVKECRVCHHYIHGFDENTCPHCGSLYKNEEEDIEMKLKDLVEIYEDNNDCVVLKVLDGKRFDLMSLGCFNGDEEYIRLTKGSDITCTVWRKEGNISSWYWGKSGQTIVTPLTKKCGELIQECVEKDLGITCRKW